MATIQEVKKLLGDGKILEALKLSDQVEDREAMADELSHIAGCLEYSTSQHYPIAGMLLQQAMLLDPKNPYIFYNMGLHHTEDGPLAEDSDSVKKAVRAYKKALRLKPDFHEARYNLALLYYFTGEYDKAKVEYQRVLESCPNDLRFLEVRLLFDK
ncbi:MAG: tetratricopeptide repeat protein [Candidatus Altiarchaeota archaeon]